MIVEVDTMPFIIDKDKTRRDLTNAEAMHFLRERSGETVCAKVVLARKDLDYPTSFSIKGALQVNADRMQGRILIDQSTYTYFDAEDVDYMCWRESDGMFTVMIKGRVA